MTLDKFAADVPADQRLAAWGIVPVMPVFFLDYDRTTVKHLVDFAAPRFFDYDIYRTAKGYHLVGACESWDLVQRYLDEAKKTFPRLVYIWNCRKLRLRVSPKWNAKGEVSAEPSLYLCRCKDGVHHEKRKGRLEGYWTL